MLFSVDTKVRGRFSEKRCGPSRRCAQNASAALENFVCYSPKDFFDSIDPTATLAVQCGNGFHAVSSPYQCARPNRYDAVTGA
jgi:hypothetical protein